MTIGGSTECDNQPRTAMMRAEGDVRILAWAMLVMAETRPAGRSLRFEQMLDHDDARVVEQFRGTTNGVVTTFVVATTVE